MWNNFLFVGLPYVALAVFVIFWIHRYRTGAYGISSLSSQFFESKKLYFGTISWHYGIIPILVAHALAFLFPEFWTSLLGTGTRLIIIESLGIGLALYSLFGLLVLFYRRFTAPRLGAVTRSVDFFVLLLLIVQVVTGVLTAIIHRWGGLWFTGTASGWFYSLLKASPDASRVSVLPFLVKLHIVMGIVIVLILPFTRLFHLLTVPLSYLTRPLVLVIFRDEPGDSGLQKTAS